MTAPVNTVAAGGIAVVDVTATLPKMGMPVSEAGPGKGTAVTKVAAYGMPVTFVTAWSYPTVPTTNNKAIDGTAGGLFSTTNTGTITLTTTQANDVVLLMFYHENKPGATAPTISTVTSSHLTWARRKTFTFAVGASNQDLEIWWAAASAPLSSEVITITLTGSIDDAAYHAFGVSGCPNPSSPWDTHASLAGANVNVPISFGTGTISGVSTNSTVSMLIGAWGNTLNRDITIPVGTTQARPPQHNTGGSFFAFMGSFYQLNSTALSSVSIMGTGDIADVWGMTVDALA